MPAHARHGQLALRLEHDLPVGDRGRSAFVVSVSDEPLSVDTVSELAWHLADEYGRRVLLVDASFAGSGLSAALGCANERGLMDLLDLGTFDAESTGRFLRRTGHGSIALLPPGRGSGGHLSPMRPDVLREFLGAAVREFDYVLVQGPVVRRGRRALVFASLADAVLLVVTHDITRLTHLEEAHRVLVNCGARSIGLVVASSTEQPG